MPEEWTLRDASEKKRKADENHGCGPGRPRRAERSTGEENNNLRLVEGGRGGGGGGEENLEESGGEESQESGSEEAIKHSLKRSKTGHARDPDHDPDWVEARIPKDILNDIMPVAVKEGLSVANGHACVVCVKAIAGRGTVTCENQGGLAGQCGSGG